MSGFYRAVTLGSMGLVAALGSTLAWVVARQVTTPPPFSYSQKAYLPRDTSVCPGEILEWSPKLNVTEAPAMLAVARTVWDVTNQMTLRSDSQLEFFVWTGTEMNQSLSRPTYFRVPKNLPAGVYEIKVGATAFNSDAAAYRVPFIVPDDCPVGTGG